MEGMDKFRTARALQLAELSAGVTIGAGGSRRQVEQGFPCGA